MPDCPADWQPTPEQIAADQRRDIAQAVNDLGTAATVLTVSDATGLHPFVVVRRLKELGAAVAGMDWRPMKKERTAGQQAETARFMTDTQKVKGQST